MSKVNQDCIAQRDFRQAQLEPKRARAFELAKDPRLSRIEIARLVGVPASTLGAWWKKAGIRPGDQRKAQR